MSARYKKEKHEELRFCKTEENDKDGDGFEES